MAYTIVLDPRAVQDIQERIDYYEDQQPGLGKEFEEHVDQDGASVSLVLCRCYNTNKDRLSEKALTKTSTQPTHPKNCHFFLVFDLSIFWA